MRALQFLHEGFGRSFGAAMSALLRTIIEVRLTSVDQLTYSEFVFSLENPTCFNLLRAHPLDGNIILDLNYENNIVDLKEGAFQQDLFGGRLQLNFSPDLQLSSFVQYDNDSDLFGTNTRMRWTITPLTDLFVVYNYNINKILEDRWQFESNQFIVKLSYGLWY